MPVLLADRMPMAALRAAHPAVLQALQAQGFAPEDREGLVQFCGMVRLATGGLAVFLPRALQADAAGAALTMRALARYGREAKTRTFTRDGAAGTSGLLAVIQRLAEDFIRSGLFHETERVAARDTGKPDWGRTVRAVLPVEDARGGDLYPTLLTSRVVESDANLVAQIQRAVLQEILADHGWWLAGLQARRGALRSLGAMPGSRGHWPRLLTATLPRLYSARALALVADLLHYLRDSRGSVAGTMVFGIGDFHWVWEGMLRATLLHAAPGWNARLPKPGYHLADGTTSEALSRGMQLDIVIEAPERVMIVDAKYYAAGSAASAPGWPDIAKQMFYELALRAVLPPDRALSSCFVFPATGAGGALSETLIGLPGAGRLMPIAGFPKIHCIYLDMARVIASYLGHRRDLALDWP